MDTLREVIVSIGHEVNDGNDTKYCTQATAMLDDTRVIVSNAAPFTDGEYYFDIAIFHGNGPTMTGFCDEYGQAQRFIERCGVNPYVLEFETRRVRHYAELIERD
jgi:hypothetical protein